MGKRGPAKTPTATLEQRGSWRAKEREGEPQPEKLSAAPAPPADLSDPARVYWTMLSGSLWASGRLTVDDLPSFARYCRMMARFDELESGADVRDRAIVMSLRDIHTTLKEYDARFGLTPADRAEMKAPATDDAAQPVGRGGLGVVA